jgi:protoporphyrinogen oxidase
MADARSAASSRTADAIGSVIVIGAGPAGLTAAYELTRLGVRTTVFDQDQRVGGLAQTASYKGFRFDIGGHRFFTKLPLVQALWRQMLGADFLKRPRLSRIYYGGKFFHYPLKATNTLGNLGVFTSLAVLVSYARAKVSPVHPVVSFEDWISNKFGRKLFEMFFKSYTEKVWGIPCNQISAEWAAQRIKGLSLRTALLNMIMGDRGRLWTKGSIKTLIGEFEYPRLGPGMMWEAFRDRIVAADGRVELGCRVVSLVHDGAKIVRVEIERDGQRTTHAADHVIATMPVRELASVLTPALPQEALDAANRLAYRDFVTVAIVVRQRDVFPDNWIYIHDPSVQVGRIQNFKNWSPEMVPDAAMTCLGLEYFCSEGDALWSLSDEAFVDLARREVVQIGLAAADAIVDGAVVRAKKAYPVYDAGYVDALNIVRRHLKPLANLQLIGRNGMHKYNNQDHSMLTAFLAVRNLLGERHDLWAVNADDEYHEELSDIEIGANAEAVELSDIRALAETQPRVPIRIESAKS